MPIFWFGLNGPVHNPFSLNRSKGPESPKTKPTIVSPVREAVQVASPQQFPGRLLPAFPARGAREVAQVASSLKPPDRLISPPECIT